jgi:ATP-dependent Lon protease
MLDEIDKMSMDFRGDPSAALLEVLDPEQNYMFVDHYLDVEYDLSQVFFIATANVLHTIPSALQDRMEVIRLSGYTELEKMEIAKRFLVRKQMEGTGMADKNVKFTDEGLQVLVQNYTREAGVRNLEREIGNVCRKVARQVVNNMNGDNLADLPQTVIQPQVVTELLGPAKFRDIQTDKKNEVGAVTGLAWTEVGGQILTTEATTMEGRGKLSTTGKLGDVMQESAHAAMSYLRSRAHLFGLPEGFLPPPGHSRARSGRGDSQGRAVGRHHYCDCHRKRAHGHSGSGRHCDDRRNHAARKGAPDRRVERKASRCAPSRHP